MKVGAAIFFDLHPYIVAPIGATDTQERSMLKAEATGHIFTLESSCQLIIDIFHLAQLTGTSGLYKMYMSEWSIFSSTQP